MHMRGADMRRNIGGIQHALLVLVVLFISGPAVYAVPQTQPAGLPAKLSTGRVALEKADLVTARRVLEEVVAAAEKDDQALLPQALTDLGKYYSFVADYSQAEPKLRRALRLLEKQKREQTLDYA